MIYGGLTELPLIILYCAMEQPRRVYEWRSVLKHRFGEIGNPPDGRNRLYYTFSMSSYHTEVDSRVYLDWVCVYTYPSLWVSPSFIVDKGVDMVIFLILFLCISISPFPLPLSSFFLAVGLPFLFLSYCAFCSSPISLFFLSPFSFLLYPYPYSPPQRTSPPPSLSHLPPPSLPPPPQSFFSESCCHSSYIFPKCPPAVNLSCQQIMLADLDPEIYTKVI